MRSFTSVIRLSFLSVILAFAGSAVAGPPLYTWAVWPSQGPGVSATNPMGMTYDGTNIWVSYTNGAARDGSDGKSSTIVEYSTSGTVLAHYSVPGDVEGLKWWSSQNEIWALQNPGGNSTVTVIHPGSGISPDSPLIFFVTSAVRGYEDALFIGTNAYLSYTAPVNPTDATIQQVASAKAPLTVSTILQMNATGENVANQKTDRPTLQNDPHSLRQDPSGDIMMSSANDGQLIYVASPGPSQTVTFLNVVNSVEANVTGLNDLLYNSSKKGTFYVADTGNNRIVAITASGLTINSLYGTIGSLSAFAQIDRTLGTVTSLFTNLNSPNGLIFVGN